MDKLIQKDEDEFPGSFREKVIQGLTVLRTGQTNLIERVSKINGSIKELYNRTEENNKDLLEHIVSCPLKDKVSHIDMILAGHPSLKETSDKFDAFAKSINDKVDQLSLHIAEHTAVKTTEDDFKTKMWTVVQPLVWIIGAAILTLILTHANQFLPVG
jgi:hypothetical protein